MNARSCVQLNSIACLLLAALLVCGCNPNEPADRANEGNSPSDRFAIKEAVLKDLFDFQDPRMHPIRQSISAYVIDDPEFGKRLAAAFSGHVPPVKLGPTTVNEQGEDLDQAAGKPVEVYSVRIREISCNRARIGAGWRSAPLVGIWYTYDLVRVKGVWTIKDKAVVGIT
jgi:hypothetical protein